MSVSVVTLIKPAQADTLIPIQLPFHITSSGHYVITSSWYGGGTPVIGYNDAHVGLYIDTTSNVIVDGQNFTIAPSGTEDAIQMLWSSNVLLENINETGANHGLFEQGSSSFTIQNCNLTNNGEGGIYLSSSYSGAANNFTIQNCNINGNNEGIIAQYSTNFALLNSHIDGNGVGLDTYYANNFGIQNCSFNDTTSTDGVSAANTMNFFIKDSNLTFCSDSGLGAYNCQNFTIQNCNLNSNNGDGIYTNGFTASLVTIKNSTFNNNFNEGIGAPNAVNWTVQGSNFYNNGNVGMDVEAASNITVSGSIFNANFNDGLYIEDTDNVVVNGNSFTSSYVAPTIEPSIGTNAAGLDAVNSNCTVINNVFSNNPFAVAWRLRADSAYNSEVYANNIFVNNYYTINLQSDSSPSITNQQISFYNNLVNDTQYIKHTGSDAAASIISLNTNLQLGQRIYSLGSRIGGNFWARPNGSGFSQTGTDANHDGFIDTPFDLFGDGICLDNYPYSTGDAFAYSFTSGTGQSLIAGQISSATTVQLHDSFGGITCGFYALLNSTSSSGKFYSDSAGTYEMSILPFLAGSSTASFYYVDTKAGAPTLRVYLSTSLAVQTQFIISHGSPATVVVTPAGTSVTAGTPQTFSATASDAYGNTWDATSATTWSISSGAGGSWSSNTYTSATAGTWTVTGIYASSPYTTSLIVNPGALDHFLLVPSGTVTAGTAFTLTITAQDAFGNTVTSYTGTNSLTVSTGTITPSTTPAFTLGVWSGSVTISAAGSGVTVGTSGGGKSGTSSGFTVTPPITTTASPSPSPTPTPTPTPVVTSAPTAKPTPTPKPSISWINATVETGGVVEIPITGNITSVQYENATIAATASGSTLTLSFNVTGTAGTVGFGNMTISKSTVPAGALPVVYIDGQRAQNQGYTQDSQNFYVWYYTHFSTHQVKVEFTGSVQPTATPAPTATTIEIVLIVVVAVVAVLAVVALTISRRGKSKPKEDSPK